MSPFTASELGADFDLERALRFGTIPVVWCSSDPRATLESYVQLYLREEIRAEALVRNLAGFTRFLPIAALFHGQVINVAGVARDAGVARTTIEGYLDILEDTLLTVRLPAYEAKLRVRERRHPKLYWIDAGLARAAKRTLGSIAPEERGALFEGWILHLLRAHAAETTDLYEDISYWSSHGSARSEVDFILRRGQDFLAVEAKSSSRYTTQLLTGLRAIGELPGLRRRILVYTGRRAFRSEDGIEIWPAERFANHVANGTLWP